MSKYYELWLGAIGKVRAEGEAKAAKKGELWVGSPFFWLLKEPSGTKGKVIEKAIKIWCDSLGLKVTKAKDAQADLIVEGKRVEVKMSTLWTGDNIYKFQQIRNQAYDMAFFVGISPNEVHAWVIPKAVVIEKSVPQHTGNVGKDTRWLTVSVSQIPEWLEEYGGRLSQDKDVEKILKILKNP